MNDYYFKVRCPETGNLVGDCGCFFCVEEFEPPEFAIIEEYSEDDEDDEFWNDEE